MKPAEKDFSMGARRGDGYRTHWGPAEHPYKPRNRPARRRGTSSRQAQHGRVAPQSDF